MLKAVPKHLFSWDFTVYEGGAPVADLGMGWIREAADVVIGGVACRLHREHLLSGAFLLEAEGHVLLRAVKPSALRRKFEITYDDRHFTLEAASALWRDFELREADHVVGTVKPMGLLTRKALANLPEALPLVVRVFVVWLVLLMWKRSADSAS